jgi:hypothetical protein
MTRETTSFVYVTYILSTPEKVFEAITGRSKALLGPRERLRLEPRIDMGTCPRQ